MSASAELVPILGALLIVAVSPGPSFVLASRISMSRSRWRDLAAAVGMGVGGIAIASFALLGLAALLNEAAWLYFALKFAGTLCLAWIGIRIWRGASTPLEAPQNAILYARSAPHSLALALVTQAGNPKTGRGRCEHRRCDDSGSPAVLAFVGLPPLVFTVEAGWYAVAPSGILGRATTLVLSPLQDLGRPAGRQRDSSAGIPADRGCGRGSEVLKRTAAPALGLL